MTGDTGRHGELADHVWDVGIEAVGAGEDALALGDGDGGCSLRRGAKGEEDRQDQNAMFWKIAAGVRIRTLGSHRILSI